MTAKNHKVDDLVRIIDTLHSHGFEHGEVVRITKVNDNDYTAEKLDGTDYWWVDDNEIEADAPDPAPVEGARLTPEQFQLLGEWIDAVAAGDSPDWVAGARENAYTALVGETDE